MHCVLLFYSKVSFGIGDCCHVQTTADECCEACRSNEMCNVWVYCGSTDGCGGDRQHRECWLKHQEQLNLLNIDGSVGGGDFPDSPTVMLWRQSHQTPASL